MMPLSIFFALVGFSFVSSITPGPNNIMLFYSGVNFGFKRTIPHALGIFCGFASLLLSVGFGLGVIFDYFPFTLILIKILGGAYMLYLAWKIAFSGPISETEGAAKPMSLFAAALFQWVNPKAWVMATVAMSTYASMGDYFTNLLLVTLAFCLVNLPCVSLWAVGGQFFRSFLQDSKKLKLFNYTMAIMLILSLWPMLH